MHVEATQENNELSASFHPETAPLDQWTFVAVGPPRTGTTWLHEALADQANLPQFNKETRFFDTNYDRGFQWYAAHFDRSKQLPMGEICPTYFISSLAPQRISRLAPRTKILCTFRDPVARIFSLYKIKQKYGLKSGTFEQALACDPELLESGRYAFHFARWRRAFGPENVLGMVYEDLTSDPQAYLDRIATFVGIPPFRLERRRLERANSSEGATRPRSPSLARMSVAVAEWLKARHRGHLVASFKRSKMNGLLLGGGHPVSKPSPATGHELRKMLCAEVEMLEDLLDRDLSAWKGRGDREDQSADGPPHVLGANTAGTGAAR